MNIKNRETGFNKLQISLSAGSHFVIDIYQNFYIGLIPVLTYKFGLSLFEVTLLGATSVIANSLFSPILGYMADRYGLKYFIITGLLISSVFLSLLGIIPNFWVILLVLFFGNLGIAAFHPASAAMAGHYGGKRKGFSTSLINFGGGFGSAFGSLMIILILKKIGANYTPLAMILGITVSLVLLKYLPSQKPKKQSSEELNFFTKLKKVNNKKLYLISILIFTVYSLYIVWISLVNYMPLYFTELKISLIDIGVILFLFGTIGGGSGFLCGYLYDRFKKGNFIIQIGLIISIPVIFLIFQPQETASIILFISSGLFLISIQPVCIRMSQDLLPRNMGLASSLILGLSSGLAGVTMIFIGKIADIIGIAKLIRFELLLILLAFFLLFSYPIVEKKLKKL